jgi:hypothetical protein
MTIGRFNFDLSWEPDFWLGGYRWSTESPHEADDSPEEKHYEFLRDESKLLDWEDEYAADLQRLLGAHPFVPDSQ